MLRLVDLIQLAGVELKKFKIHCATGRETLPLDAFFAGQFKDWQEGQTQKNFQRPQVLSLIHLGRDKWLFAGVFEVLGVSRRKGKLRDGYMYSTREIAGLEHLVGRVIVQFNKTFRQSYLRGERYLDQLLVAAIREEPMTIGDFPGFNSVRLPLDMMRLIIKQDLPQWRTPLANVSAVYLITDTATGLQYVGSASGGEGIWQRWSSYANNGHGGIKELRELLNDKGKEYASNFQFSLLEVWDLNASIEYVISRENHWKEVLGSRTFGLNRN